MGISVSNNISTYIRPIKTINGIQRRGYSFSFSKTVTGTYSGAYYVMIKRGNRFTATSKARASSVSETITDKINSAKPGSISYATRALWYQPYTSNGGGGTPVSAGSSVTPKKVTYDAGDIVFVYNANGGLVSTAYSLPYIYGNDTYHDLAIPKRAGYRFLGWNSAMNGSGVYVREGQTANLFDTDTTLYAQWEKITNVDVIARYNGTTKVVTLPTTSIGVEYNGSIRSFGNNFSNKNILTLLCKRKKMRENINLVDTANNNIVLVSFNCKNMFMHTNFELEIAQSDFSIGQPVKVWGYPSQRINIYEEGSNIKYPTYPGADGTVIVTLNPGTTYHFEDTFTNVTKTYTIERIIDRPYNAVCGYYMPTQSTVPLASPARAIIWRFKNMPDNALFTHAKGIIKEHLVAVNVHNQGNYYDDPWHIDIMYSSWVGPNEDINGLFTSDKGAYSFGGIGVNVVGPNYSKDDSLTFNKDIRNQYNNNKGVTGEDLEGSYIASWWAGVDAWNTYPWNAVADQRHSYTQVPWIYLY